MFDRVAVAFAAMVLGLVAGFVVALPLLLLVGAVTSDTSRAGAFLLWRLPLLLGLISGVIGFFSPGFAADWLGKVWKGVINTWRVFVGR